MSHSWVIEGWNKNSRFLTTTCLPTAPRDDSQRQDALLIESPWKTKQGQRATAFSRTHFIPLWARLLPPTTLWWHSILPYSEHLQDILPQAPDIHFSLLSPNSASLLRSLARPPLDTEHSDVFTNTFKVKNSLFIVMLTGTNMTRKDRLHDRTWL